MFHPPQKCPFLLGIWTAIKYIVPWTHESALTGTTIGWAIFAQLTCVPDRQTKRTNCNICSHSPHLIHYVQAMWRNNKVKDKGCRYSLPSIGPGADPGVQAVAHPAVGCHYLLPGLRLPFQPAAAEHHRPLASTKLYCLVTVVWTTCPRLPCSLSIQNELLRSWVITIKCR